MNRLASSSTTEALQCLSLSKSLDSCTVTIRTTEISSTQATLHVSLRLDASNDTELEAVRELSALAAQFIKQRAGSALHHAIVNGSHKSIALLLASGANANHFDNGTPLHLAVTCGRWRVAQLLIDCGADVSFVMPGFGSALHRAVTSASMTRKSTKRMVRLLIRSGVDVDARGAGAENDRTALHCAAVVGNVVALSELIRFGAALDIQTNSGETALSLALKHDKRDVVHLLLAAGANLQLASPHIETAQQRIYGTATN